MINRVFRENIIQHFPLEDLAGVFYIKGAESETASSHLDLWVDG